MDTKPKTYKMLKTVPGSRDGITVETFTKDEIRNDIGPDLAEQFYHLGAIEEIDGESQEGDESSGKAKKGQKVNPADARETKVSGPTETKVTGPTAYKGEEGEAGIDPKTQRTEELNATARDHYGLGTDTTMEPQAVRDAIEDAAEGKEADLPASKAEPLTTESHRTAGKRKK